MSHYKTLGVDKKATVEQIKKAYRSLSLKFHPDKNPNGEEEYKKINAAYSILGDINKKKQYALFGDSDVGGETGFWSQGSFHSNRAQNTKILKVEVTLEELFNGIDKKIKITKKEHCVDCNLNVKICTDCGGLGMKTVFIRQGPFSFPKNVECKLCKHGKILNGKCIKCKNKGFILKDDELNINNFNGQMEMLFYNMGDYGEALFVNLIVKKHPVFEKSDNNIILNLNILIEESLNFNRKIKLLDSQEIYIMTENPIIHGDIYMLKGKGIGDGNLFINFTIKNILNKEKIIECLNKKIETKNYTKLIFFKNKIDFINERSRNQNSQQSEDSFRNDHSESDDSQSDIPNCTQQ